MRVSVHRVLTQRFVRQDVFKANYIKMHLTTFCILSILMMTAAYDDIDEKFDHNSQLNDVKQLRQLLDCFLDKGYCTEVESHIKAHLLDLIMTNCQNCDTKQKHYAHIYLNNVKKYFPEGYEEYKKKYDLDGKHLESLEKAISTF